MIKRLLSNKIIKNFSILTGTNILIQLLQVLSSVRVARLLEPHGYGMYNVMMVQAGIFTVIATWGLSMVIIRYVARNRSDSKYIFHISNIIRIGTTLLAIFVFLIYNIFLGKDNLSPLFLFLIASLIIFQSFWDSIQNISFGNERMEPSGYINLLFTVTWIIFIYAIPKAGFNLSVVFTIYVINYLVKTISYYFWLNRSILSKDQASIGNPDITISSIFKQSNFFFILAIFGAIQSQIPILFLGNFSDVSQVGIFNLGNRILSPMQMALGMALTSLYPYFSRLAITNKILFTERVKDILNLLVIFGVGCCICFYLFSKEIVSFLYGEAYLDSAKVILIQCWVTVLRSIFNTLGTVLSSFDRQKLLAGLSIVSSVIGVPIFIVGAKYGATGLAWAFLISGFINMTYHWVIFRNILSKQLTFRYSLKLFSYLIIATVCSLIIPFELSFAIKLIAGVAIMGLTAYYVKVKVLDKVLSNIDNSN